MASRRIRIKTVINIPPRRKNGSDETSVKTEQSSITDFIPKSENVGETGVGVENKCNQDSALITLSVNNDENETVDSTEGENINCNDGKVDDLPIFEVTKTESNDVPSDCNNFTQKDQPKDPPIVRRKFIKPTISVNSFINRKPKADLDKIDVKNKGIENIVITRDEENRKPIDLESCLETFQTSHTTNLNIKQTFSSTSSISNGEITLNETNLIPNVGIQSNRQTPAVNQPRKPVNLVTSTYCSDTEYPPPPSSPSKINRSRIKAIPRLAYRKTSFSASESEDESRRNSTRNRNDSVCSAASGVVETLTECMSPQKPKEPNSAIQKKCTRTEQTRKIAEARREFQRRFGSNKPDRQRLTMMDLIFYNPATNPMVDDRKSKQDTCDQPQETETVEDTNSTNNETREDNCEKSDEENEMPVPQIKIGPSGEIILDEKSLVIERKELKKQREEMQKRQLIDGDFNTSYGIYKRQSKTKPWTQAETLRFYKALNTLGTDFTLMNELFPKRTRRELKMKFNREEKTNRMLIDKALMQPCSFNYNELKLELEMEEKEQEELQKQKEESTKLRQEKMENLKKRKAAKNETAIDKTKEVVAPKPPKIRRVRKKKEKLSIENVCMDNSDADESDIDTQSESDEELVLCQRPTRSGRVPKMTQKFDLTHDDEYEKYSNIGNIMRKSKISQEVRPNNIEPGSIMIITEKGESEEPVYKIYMVTQNNNAAPVDLTSELVSKAIEFKKGICAQNILTISAKVTDDEDENNDIPPEENNVTIAEDGEISLKSKPNVTPSEDATVSNMQCS